MADYLSSANFVLVWHDWAPVIAGFMDKHLAGVSSAASAISANGRFDRATLTQSLMMHHNIYNDFLTKAAGRNCVIFRQDAEFVTYNPEEQERGTTNVIQILASSGP